MPSIVRKPFFLATGRILRIEDGRGIRICPEDGRLWVTQEGDSRDHILAAGQSMVLERGRLTLVQALEASRFELQTPALVHHAGSPSRLELAATRKAA